MKRLSLVLLLAMIPLVAQERTQESGRVRAKDPTVVTVHGTADRVSTDRSEINPTKRGFGSRVGGGIKTVAGKTWNGIVGFGGWLLNSDDDIPSERQRRAESTTNR